MKKPMHACISLIPSLHSQLFVAFFTTCKKKLGVVYCMRGGGGGGGGGEAGSRDWGKDYSRVVSLSLVSYKGNYMLLTFRLCFL